MSEVAQEYRTDLYDRCPYMFRVLADQDDLQALRSTEFSRIGEKLNLYAQKTDVSFQPSQPCNVKQIPDFFNIGYDQLEELSAQEIRMVLLNLYYELGQISEQASETLQYCDQIHEIPLQRIEYEQKLDRVTISIEQKGQNKIDEVREYQQRLNKQRSEEDQKFLDEMELQRQIDRTMQRISEVKQENLSYRANRLQLDDRFVQIENTQHLIENSHNLKLEFENQIEKVKNQWDNLRTQTLDQNRILETQIKDFEKKLESVQEQYKGKLNDNKELRDKMLEIRNRLIGIQVLETKISETQIKRQEQGDNRFKSQQELIPLSDQISQGLDQINQKQLDLIEKRYPLYDKLAQMSYQQLNSNDTILNEYSEHYKLKLQVTLQEQLCCIKEDLFQLTQLMKKQRKQLTSYGQHLLPVLNRSAEFLNNNANLFNQETKLTDQLVNDIENFEFEIAELQQLIESIRNRDMLYIPIKTDPIDVALAEYLNSRTCKSPVQLQRQDYGVYQFGSKRIFLKLEQGSLKVKTAGGYNHLDEFLQFFMPDELLKQEKSVIEISPQHKRNLMRFKNDQNMSPTRASRILATSLQLTQAERRLRPASSRIPVRGKKQSDKKVA